MPIWKLRASSDVPVQSSSSQQEARQAGEVVQNLEEAFSSLIACNTGATASPLVLHWSTAITVTVQLTEYSQQHTYHVVHCIRLHYVASLQAQSAVLSAPRNWGGVQIDLRLHSRDACAQGCEGRRIWDWAKLSLVMVQHTNLHLYSIEVQTYSLHISKYPQSSCILKICQWGLVIIEVPNYFNSHLAVDWLLWAKDY